jgi:hypothetical protein
VTTSFFSVKVRNKKNDWHYKEKKLNDATREKQHPQTKKKEYIYKNTKKKYGYQANR